MMPMASPVQELLDELDRMANRADRADRHSSASVYRESQDMLRDYAAEPHSGSFFDYGMTLFGGFASEGSDRAEDERKAFGEVRDTLALVADVRGIKLDSKPEGPMLF
jgi:hypothetical protein